MRFYYASQMYDSGAVQLYPRTSQVLLLAALAAGVVGCYSGIRGGPTQGGLSASFFAEGQMRFGYGAVPRGSMVGWSATAGSYSPAQDGSRAELTWDALHSPDGQPQ